MESPRRLIIPFKRRRRKKTINKNDLKHRRSLEDRAGSDSSNTLRHLYPNVRFLSIDMRFQSPEGVVLSHDKRQIRADEAVDFSADCPGRCGGGQMDLLGKIETMIRDRKDYAKARARCQEPLFAGAKETCGCELQCTIEVQFDEE